MFKNEGGQYVTQQLLNTSDGSEFIDQSFIYIMGDNGEQTLGSISGGSGLHKGGGLHLYAPAQSETNYDNVVYTFSGAGAMTSSVSIYPLDRVQDANLVTISGAASGVGQLLDLVEHSLEDFADAFLDRNMASGVDSGSSSIRTPRQALRFLRNAWDTSGTTLNVYKEDDTTLSWSSTLTTTGTADAIIGVNPAGP